MTLRSLSDMRRDEIAQAALAIFVVEGADGMTLERVAKEIGASKGIILHYFSTKDALIDRVIRDASRVLGREYRTAISDTVGHDDWLRTFLGFTVSQDLFSEIYARVWLSAMAQSGRQPAFTRFRQLVVRRMRTNLIAHLKPRLGAMEAGPVAESLIALIDGLWLRRALEPSSLSPDRARALIWTHLEESLAFSG